MKSRAFASVLVLALVALSVLPAAAQPASRLTDKQVKQLISDTREAVDRFVDKMDPQMKTAILKGADYEINVKTTLKDLDESGKMAADRYNPPSSSGATEVVGYLKKLKAFDAGLAARPGMSGADKSWDDAKPVVAKLATVYGIDWSTDPAGWSGKRTTDGEVANAAADVKRLAGSLAKQADNVLKADKSMDKAARAGIVSQVKDLETAADDVSKQLKNERDASAAVTRLAEKIASVGGALPAGVTASPAGATFETIKTRVAVLTGAFGR